MVIVIDSTGSMEDAEGQPVSSERPRPFKGSKVHFALGNQRCSAGHGYQDVLGVGRDGSSHSDQPVAEVVTYSI